MVTGKGKNVRKGTKGFVTTEPSNPGKTNVPTIAKKTTPKSPEIPEGYALFGKANIPLPIMKPFVNPGPDSGLEPEEIWALWRKGEDQAGNDSSARYKGLKYGTKEYSDMSEAGMARYRKWLKDNPQPPFHSPERTARIRDYSDRKAERFAEIVGATVIGIWFADDLLTFETDKGLYTYYLHEYGGGSYFADFYGVKHLYENGPIISIEEIDLLPSDPGYLDPEAKGPRDGDAVAVYGVRITTMHPAFQEVSSVFSFRNESNGYYGSWIYRQADNGQGKESEKKWLDYISPEQVKLTEDKVGD